MAHHAAGSTIVEMQIEGEKKPVNAMIREMQTSPIKGTIMHVDFLAVEMDKPIHAPVSLRLRQRSRRREGRRRPDHQLPRDQRRGQACRPAASPRGRRRRARDRRLAARQDIVGARRRHHPRRSRRSHRAPSQAPRAEEVEEEVAEETEPEVIGEKAGGRVARDPYGRGARQSRVRSTSARGTTPDSLTVDLLGDNLRATYWKDQAGAKVAVVRFGDERPRPRQAADVHERLGRLGQAARRALRRRHRRPHRRPRRHRPARWRGARQARRRPRRAQRPALAAREARQPMPTCACASA